jgi:hypothetical protein
VADGPLWRNIAMSGDDRKTRMKELAQAVAGGQSIAQWATQNGVEERTAYRWAKKANMKTAVQSRRRRSVEQALGILSTQLPKAFTAIDTLGETAASESVRLGALKFMCSQFERVTKFVQFEERLTEVEEIQARSGHKVRRF